MPRIEIKREQMPRRIPRILAPSLIYTSGDWFASLRLLQSDAVLLGEALFYDMPMTRGCSMAALQHST